MNELDKENKPLRDELDARRVLLSTKEKDAADAKAAKDANSPPVFDLDAHSYPRVHSYWSRDAHWVQGTPGDDGFPVDILKFPAGKEAEKYKGWKWDSIPEGVTHARLNMYYKLVKEVEADGDNWGVKIFGNSFGADAIKECGVGKWCWISVVAPTSMGDAGHVLLIADDVKSAYELEVK
jgi:hypothetical protein